MEDLKNIKLGEKYWCVIKTSMIDENEQEKPEFLVNLVQGYVTAKGIQLEGENILPYVEVARQRLKATHIFEHIDDAMDKVEIMIAEIKSAQENPVPEPA